MAVTTEVLIYGGLAGAAIPIGALLSRAECFRSRWVASEVRHGITAFGAGALLSAIALVLVPPGIDVLSLLPFAVAFFGGGLAFAGLDAYLARKGSAMGLFIGMLADFLPECLVLGALFLQEASSARLLAILIAVQNLPEAFGAYREYTSGVRKAPKRGLILFALLAPLGPVCAFVGLSLLSGSGSAIALIMTFAAGGILYLMFQDIAPKVPLKNAWLPPMGALLGFFVGVVGAVLENGAG